jgi:hypothetical protein
MMEGVTIDRIIDGMMIKEETETTVDLIRSSSSSSLLRNNPLVKPILLNLCNNSRLHRAIKEVNNVSSVL